LEQRLGGVQAAAEMFGDLGDGEAVEIAQCQYGPVVGTKLGEGPAGQGDIDVVVPRVDDIIGVLFDGPEVPLFDRLVPPVVNEPAPGDDEKPRRRDGFGGSSVNCAHGRQEGVGSQILLQAHIPAATQQESVHDGKRTRIELDELFGVMLGRRLGHTLIIEQAHLSPTPSTELF
jgi:hypothetical protein